ncbi:MAG: hypothetical protein MRJ67_13515 [Nitrospirales bacterium]|nr:hypothetical protein [Nitrospirales bacterium]
MKKTYRKQISERAALARLDQGGKDVTSDELPSILRQIENTVSDLRWADVPSFTRHIKKLSHLLHDPELEEMSRKLTDGIDLDAWLKAGEATQGGMIGSARLQWPTTQNEELGIVILLIDRFAEKPNEALNFSHTFYHAGGKYIDNIQNMTAQMILPFARD